MGSIGSKALTEAIEAQKGVEMCSISSKWALKRSHETHLRLQKGTMTNPNMRSRVSGSYTAQKY